MIRERPKIVESTVCKLLMRDEPKLKRSPNPPNKGLEYHNGIAKRFCGRIKINFGMNGLTCLMIAVS
jgi:hypothetical protein